MGKSALKTIPDTAIESAKLFLPVLGAFLLREPARNLANAVAARIGLPPNTADEIIRACSADGTFLVLDTGMMTLGYFAGKSGIKHVGKIYDDYFNGPKITAFAGGILSLAMGVMAYWKGGEAAIATMSAQLGWNPAQTAEMVNFCTQSLSDPNVINGLKTYGLAGASQFVFGAIIGGALQSVLEVAHVISSDERIAGAAAEAGEWLKILTGNGANKS